jgi:hypothetical protein
VTYRHKATSKKLCREFAAVVRKGKLPREALANFLHTDVRNVYAVMRGQPDVRHVSIHRIMRWLERLGYRVEIRLT